eukprot:589710-Pleurochrysis_carterae.AAC.2
MLYATSESGLPTNPAYVVIREGDVRHRGHERGGEAKDEDRSSVFAEGYKGQGQSAQFLRVMLGDIVVLAERKKTIAKTTTVADHAQIKEDSKQKFRDFA